MSYELWVTKALLYLARNLLVHLLVGVIYEVADERVGHVAIEMDLVPMPLVPMPSPLDTAVAIAQLQRIVGLTLQHHEVGALKVHTSKYLTHEAKHQSGLVKGECLVGIGLRQALFADVFDVHFSRVLWRQK